MPRRTYICTYILLSLFFITINIITLSNLTAWIDEVMMLDTSYNMAVHGSWETTAWYRVAGQHPFSTYPPLYQMVAAVWIWLFGASLVAVRSINLLLTFILGGVCLRLMRLHGLQLTSWTVAMFTLLLWGTGEMAWMYRNGRPDMLCALIFVLTVLASDTYLSSKTPATRFTVVASSALLLCSGVQAAVCLLAFWLFLFVAMKGRRKEFARLFVLLLTGILLGMLLVSLFMQSHGRLVAFVCSILQYSATLSGIALAVLPLAGDLFAFDAVPYTQKLLELTTDTSIYERLASIADCQSFVLLSVAALAAYALCFRDRLKELVSDQGFLMLMCALYVPFIMTIAGRYPVYYRWMAFLPLLVSVMSIAARHRLCCAVFGMVALLLTGIGIKSMFVGGTSSLCGSQENIRAFVKRQHFKASDNVVCPFSTFYEMKPVCDTCYFVGIFPTEFVGHLDYIIEAPDGNEFDKRITTYVNKLKADTAVVLTAIDHCEHPSLTLYQVKVKHE